MLACIEEFLEPPGTEGSGLTVNEHEAAGLVGPNGSVKSTLLNVIVDAYRPDSGKIIFGDEDIARLPPSRSAPRARVKTSQITQPFPEITAIDNMRAGVLFAGDKARV